MNYIKISLMTILLASCFLGQTPIDSENNNTETFPDILFNAYFYTIVNNANLSGKTYQRWRFYNYRYLELREKQLDNFVLEIEDVVNGNEVDSYQFTCKLVGNMLYMSDSANKKEYKLKLGKSHDVLLVGDVNSTQMFNTKLYKRVLDND